jgi:hypothetical protein
MPAHTAESWLKTNFVGLLIVTIGLVTSFITLNSKLEVVVDKVEQRTEYMGRVQILEKEYILIHATHEAGKQYWIRFEEVLKENTIALNSVNLTLVSMQADIRINRRAIEKLERDNDT